MEGQLILDEIWESPRQDNIIKDIATFMAQLSAQSFEGVGSLCFDPNGQVHVGPLYTRHFFQYRTAHLTSYPTSAECKLAQLDHLMGLVHAKRLQWGMTPRHEEEDHDPVWAYVLYLEVRDIIIASKEMNEEQPTYVRHGDDHMSQYLCNEEGNLKAVLDWEL
jgi:hypothetical protein